MEKVPTEEKLIEFAENQILYRHHLRFGNGYPLLLRKSFDEEDAQFKPSVGIRVDKKLPVCFECIEGRVDLISNNLKSLKGLPRHVEGLDVHKAGLTELVDCPSFIHGDFVCTFNHLTSLEGCPSLVEGDFWCYGNDKEFTESEVRSQCVVYGEVLTNEKEAAVKLSVGRRKQREYERYVAEVLGLDRKQTLMKCNRRMEQVWVMGNLDGEPVQATIHTKYLKEGRLPFIIMEFNGSIALDGERALTSFYGFPPHVISLDVSGQLLTTLKGMPDVEENLRLNGNQLTSLEGCPRELSGDFLCAHSQLTTLEGAPQVVGGSVWCSGRTLVSLKGGPQMVGGNFQCDATGITSLEGCPKYVGGEFICYNCGRVFSADEVRQQCTVMDDVKTLNHKQIKDREVNSDELLSKYVWRKATQRYGDTLTPRQEQRIRYELEVIERGGFAQYLLNHCGRINMERKAFHRYVRVGRGSAVGSVVCYCLGITEVDPLRFDGLLFERFINPDHPQQPHVEIELTKEKLKTNDLPLDDEATMRLFREGKTEGIYLFESEALKPYLRQLKRLSFTDLVAINTLWRPDLMELMPRLVALINGEESPSYPLPEKESILGETYGLLIYQEQAMLLCQRLADFTPGESDDLRLALCRRDQETLSAMKQKFLQQGTRSGHSTEALSSVWEQIRTCGPIAMNKSHVLASTLISFHDAYTQVHNNQ